MKNRLVKVLLMMLVAGSVLTACGGKENSDISQDTSKGNTTMTDNTGSSNVEQSDTPQFVELSEEEKIPLEIMAQFITATRWGEELWGKTISPTEENVCSFISRMASENQYYKMGEYSSFLPKGTNDEIYGTIYMAEDINTYATEVFGLEIADINAVWNWMDGDKCLIMETQYPSGDSAEITYIEMEDEALIVHGTVAWGEYEELDLYGGGLAFYNCFEFDMKVEENENSPFGYTFVSIEYFGDRPGALNSNIDLFKDVLLHPEMYEEFYFYDFGARDIYFTLSDVNGDGVKDLILAANYREKYQAPGDIINVLIQKGGKVYDLDGAHHYNNLGKFTLYDTGIMKTECEDEEESTNFYNLATGQIWAGRRAAKSVSGGTYSSITDLETNSTYEGELGNAKFNELSAGEEVELVWYLATEENVNNMIGN